jgi:hypothetical protein
MLMDLMSYIVNQAYILIPVLYIIGVFLKRIPNLKDWLIPWILLALGMAGGFFLSGMQIGGILQGVLVTGVTVFANQVYKQTVVKSKEDESVIDKQAIAKPKGDEDTIYKQTIIKPKKDEDIKRYRDDGE